MNKRPMIIHRCSIWALLATFILLTPLGSSARAEGEAPTTFKHIPLQYIVALGDPNATSGSGAQAWGLWRQDPGPRGCLLEGYDKLKAADGVAPAQWKFDSADWWLEEHGVIMEKPEFPLPPGKYVVTGGREVTSILTIHPPDKNGDQSWELAQGKIYDVTHLPCHAARYKPATTNHSCSPDKVQSTVFPVAPGVPMPQVDGCNKQDYSVLFVIGVAVE